MYRVTFAKETSFNVPNLNSNLGLQLSNEQIQKNLNYQHQEEFMKPYSTKWHSPFYSVSGTFISDLTYNNTAWSYLLGSLLGERKSIPGFKFFESENICGILIGYLNNNLDSTSVTFSINEEIAGAFDNVDVVIINSEMIKVNSISNGIVTDSQRSYQDTRNMAHNAYDLIYGAVTDVNREIVLCNRKYDQGFYTVDDSYTFIVNREGAYDVYSGCKISDISFNFRYADITNSNISIIGADSTNQLDLTLSEIDDYNNIPDVEDIKVYSFHEQEKLTQFYIMLNNTMTVPSYGFNRVPQQIYMTKSSTFGQISWTEDSIVHVTDYENSERKHYSISISEGNYRMIFALNGINLNTPSHFYDSKYFIDETAPWYMHYNPVIMFQY